MGIFSYRNGLPEPGKAASESSYDGSPCLSLGLTGILGVSHSALWETSHTVSGREALLLLHNRLQSKGFIAGTFKVSLEK